MGNAEGGGLEGSRSDQDKKMASSTVVLALAGAIGMAQPGTVAGPELQNTLRSDIAMKAESFDSMRMQIAREFVVRLSKEFEKSEKTKSRIDDVAVSQLFADYLYEASPMQNNGGFVAGIAPETAVVKLEQAVVAAMLRGGIHQGAADCLISALDEQRRRMHEHLTAPLEPSPEFYDNSGEDIQQFQEPQEPLPPDPLRPRNI